jgi:hypothetical protein
MTEPPIENIQRVPPDIMRDIFNRSQYPRWITEKVLNPKFVRDDHLPKPEVVHEPYCTYSQIIRYCDVSGEWKVEIHQYFRSATNTLGASGKPDPKRMRVGNIIYIADKKAKWPPEDQLKIV